MATSAPFSKPSTPPCARASNATCVSAGARRTNTAKSEPHRKAHSTAVGVAPGGDGHVPLPRPGEQQPRGAADRRAGEYVAPVVLARLDPRGADQPSEHHRGHAFVGAAPLQNTRRGGEGGARMPGGEPPVVAAGRPPGGGQAPQQA